MADNSKPQIQIDEVVREMTSAEHQTYLADLDSLKATNAELEAKQAARESALAKLAALGLTEAEIAAL